MKLNHKIQVDILEVFKSGKFEFIKPGQTKEWILNNFPDPDDFEAGKTLPTADLWSYGDIDFYFHGGHLTQIFTDDIDTLDGGEKITIKKWILDKPNTLSVQFVIQNLISTRVSFLVKHHLLEHVSQTSVGLVESCVHLNFQPIDSEVSKRFDELDKSDKKRINPNTYVLCSITLMNNEEFKKAYNTNL